VEIWDAETCTATALWTNLERAARESGTRGGAIAPTSRSTDRRPQSATTNEKT
jgi:hypothetical protein